MKSLVTAVGLVVALVAASPASAQIGRLKQGLKKVDQARQDFTFTDAEEQDLGAEISARLREKYGVVQDRAVHKYVTLVGTVLAAASSRPNLHWTFIVLDTDGVNAFAAPGGFVHVTRGALALIRNESELAGVLGHEIGHVTAKHTIRAIQKSKVVDAGAQASRQEFLGKVADQAYAAILENSFDRGDEIDADKIGVTLASGVGYSPQGLGAFLSRLAERNRGLQDRSGMFASHPETKARLDALTKTIASAGPAGTAIVAARYEQSISYRAVPVEQVAQVAGGAAPASEEPAKSGGSGKFGLGGLRALGGEKSSTQTVASAGSRGVNPDRDAKGGPNKGLVVVTVTAADVAEFRKGIAG
jgi:predicted Zn-dependent protease